MCPLTFTYSTHYKLKVYLGFWSTDKEIDIVTQTGSVISTAFNFREYKLHVTGAMI